MKKLTTKKGSIRKIASLTTFLPLLLAGCVGSSRENGVVQNNPVLPSTTNAPSPTPPPKPLSVDQAIDRALACNSKTASLKAAIEIARQNRRAATDIKDPVVQGATRSQGQQNNSGAWDDSRFSATFYLPNPWLTVPRVNGRSADLLAAEADLRAATWLVICDVKKLYAEIDHLTNDIAFATRLVQLEGEVLKAVRTRVDQGAATATDLTIASRKFLQTRENLDETRHRCKLAQRSLAALLNKPIEDLRIDTSLLTFPPLPESGIPLEQAEAAAVQNRSDLAALHWRLSASASYYREIRNERMLWIKEIKAGYLDQSEKWWVGAAMDVPIFTWTKNHASDIALAKQSLAGLNETEGLKVVRQEISDAIDEVNESRRQQTYYNSEVAPLIASMRQSLATLKATPNVMPDQLANAEIQLVESQRLDEGCRWRYRSALLYLERTLGNSIDQAVQEKKP